MKEIDISIVRWITSLLEAPVSH